MKEPWDQAVKYGVRFTNRGKEAFLNTYEFADDLSKWKVIEESVTMKHGLIL